MQQQAQGNSNNFYNGQSNGQAPYNPGVGWQPSAQAPTQPYTAAQPYSQAAPQPYVNTPQNPQAAPQPYVNTPQYPQAAPQPYANTPPYPQAAPQPYANTPPYPQAAPQPYANTPQYPQAAPQTFVNAAPNPQLAPLPYANAQPNQQFAPQPYAQAASQPYINTQQNAQAPPQFYMNAQQNVQAATPPPPATAVNFNAPLPSSSTPSQAPISYGSEGPLVERKVKAGDTYVTVLVPAASGAAMTGGVDVDKRWPRSKMPLKVFIKRGDGVPRYLPAYYDLVKECCHEWEVATKGKVGFVFVDSVADCDLDVEWIEYGHNIGRDNACGTTKFFSANGYVLTAKVYLATTMPDRWLGGKQDTHTMRHTILHEMGHVLGLTHSPFNTDIMYFQSNARQRVMVQGIIPVNIDLPVNISPNDWRRINTLYP
jgi:predicted Zn-dependent protease